MNRHPRTRTSGRARVSAAECVQYAATLPVRPLARLTLTALTLALNPVVTAAAAAPVSACEGLDAKGREAMQWFISGAFPIPSPWITCREDNGANAAALRRQRSASVPCLLQIYRSGLANTGLWLRREPPPTDGAWTINVLGQVDPNSAIDLWREKAATTHDPWLRAFALLQMGRLGNRAVLHNLAAVLADPRPMPGLKPRDRDDFLADAADLIAQYDYRPGLSALQKLNNPPRPSLRWLDLHILQLQGDVGALERRTRDNDAPGANAVRALYRMHAREALTRIADDPMHPRSGLAHHYLGLNFRL